MFYRIIAALTALTAIAGLAAAQPARPQPKYEPLPNMQKYDPATGARILPPLVYQNETPEQRKLRLGTTEDPGPDPDPTIKWVRFGQTYTIMKFQKVHAVYDQPRYGWVRPDFRVNVATEIYQENDEFVWVWMKDISVAQVLEKIRLNQEMKAAGAVADKAPVEAAPKYDDQAIKFVEQVRKEFAVVDPPKTDAVVTFRESSEGLPQTGSWRNGLDVADMNEDGKLDLVVPPQRGGGTALPQIFLGDGKGGWKVWEAAKWPSGFDYGTAVVGDLNKDGHQDVVFAVHLYGVIAFLGDGKGNFTNVSKGLPSDFPTRRVKLVDLDRDGDLDILAISEGAVLSQNPTTRPFLRGYLNQGKAKEWLYVEVLDNPWRDIAGDWLVIGDFNGDKLPDMAGSSVIFNGNDVIYLSKKEKMKWDAFGRGWLPFYSYYNALATARISSSKQDDLIMSYARHWPRRTDPNLVSPPPFERVVGIDWVSFAGKEPTRKPIVRWEGERPIFGLATADFNRDRHVDVIYWNSEIRQIEILLGNGKGDFRKASIEGMEIPDNVLYDIKVADVNGDKRPDVLLMFEAAEGMVRNGAIRAWLSQPATGAAVANKQVAKGRS